ncbi:MAG: NlpC/P60 family protein, partial [Ornithinimicrobium sp.]
GRHRAPSRISLTSTAMTRTAKFTAVAATSGGLLAAAAVPASASPRTTVGDLASVAQDNSTGTESVVDLMAVELPPVVAPSDRPAVAAVAPKATPVVKEATFGTAGFVGVEPPAPEPVVEPAPEEAATEAVAADTSVSETAAPEAVESTASTNGSTESTQSSGSSESQSTSTSSRESTASSRTEEREAAPEPAPEPEAAPAPKAATGGVLGVAAQYSGIMYRYGGTTPAGFDCSGYTSYVYRQVGVSLPRTAEGQRQATTRVSNPQPGDLVFFGSPAYHVGIYAGNGMMYDSGKPGIPSQLRSVFGGVSGYGRVG